MSDNEWMTPQMVHLFKVMQIMKKHPELFGANEYNEACSDLHNMLQRECYESDVMDANEPIPSVEIDRSANQLDDWKKARAIYVALEKAATAAPDFKYEPGGWSKEQVAL